MKKFLCLFLTAMLLLTAAVIFPVSATESTDDTTDVTYTAPVFYGVQPSTEGTTAENTQNLRFVSIVPNGNGTVLGYEIWVKYTKSGETTTTYVEYEKNATDETMDNMESDTVYASVKAGGYGEVTAAALGEEKGIENPYGLFAVAITGVPTNLGAIQFDVRTYVKEDDEIKAKSSCTSFKVENGTVNQTTITPDPTWATEGGDGTATYPYVINQTNFLNFYEGNQGKTMSASYVLESDVVLTGTDGTFNSSTGTLSGTFDGNKHSISGLTIDSTDRAALFYQIDAGGVLRNLSVINSTMTLKNATGYQSAGTFVGRLSGRIENCYSSANIKTSSANSGNIGVGGIAGSVISGTGTINNCVFAGSVGAANVRAGGILGFCNNSGTANITNCLNVATQVNSTASRAGGIVGYVFGPVTVTNCINLCSNITASSGNTATNADFFGGKNGTVTINSYRITDAEYTTGRVGDGYSGTVPTKTLAEFIALVQNGTVAGWSYTEGNLPTPLAWVQIPESN